MWLCYDGWWGRFLVLCVNYVVGSLLFVDLVLVFIMFLILEVGSYWMYIIWMDGDFGLCDGSIVF